MELNPERWDAFTDEECATICLGAVCLLMEVFYPSDDSPPATMERKVEALEIVTRLVSECNVKLGNDAVDMSLVAAVKEKLEDSQ